MRVETDKIARGDHAEQSAFLRNKDAMDFIIHKCLGDSSKRLIGRHCENLTMHHVSHGQLFHSLTDAVRNLRAGFQRDFVKPIGVAIEI